MNAFFPNVTLTLINSCASTLLFSRMVGDDLTSSSKRVHNIDAAVSPVKLWQGIIGLNLLGLLWILGSPVKRGTFLISSFQALASRKFSSCSVKEKARDVTIWSKCICKFFIL